VTGSHLQFCTFHLAGLHFGVEVPRVQEVLKSLEITPVPLSLAEVQGLINLRGQIVTAVDLRRRLNLPENEGASPSINLVLRGEDGVMSLLVDDIGDVVEVSQDDVETPPETLPPSIRLMVPRVYKLKDSLLHVLDTEQTLDLHTSAVV